MIVIIIALILLIIRHRLCKCHRPETMTPKQEVAAERLRIAEANRLARIEKENQRRMAQAEKHRQKVVQALEDIPFYDTQLERLYPTAEAIKARYTKACEAVDRDTQLNQYGAVISDKEADKHLAERDKLLKKLIITENQIHALERKRAQAKATARS